MKLTSTVLKSTGRQVKKEVTPPFKAHLPLALRDRVSVKSQATKQESVCMFEMSLLLACMKDNNFTNHLCTKEITEFNKCFTKYLEASNLKRAEKTNANIKPGQTEFSQMQITNLLKKFSIKV